MKKLFIAAALGAIATSASAQSSTTMYGIADMFAGYAKAGAVKQTRMNEGAFLASQWGIRGTEDLGGGLKANYTFEAGIATDTGAGNLPGPNLAFTRQSFVGLSGDSWGAITVGRQYTPIFRSLWRTDPFGVNAVFSTTGLWAQNDGQTDLLPWTARYDNAIMYASPTSLPIQGSVMFAPGEASAPSTRSGNYLSANLHYDKDGLLLGYAYQQRRSGTAAAPVVSPTTANAHLVFGHYQTEKFRVGASYGRQSANIVGSNSSAIVNVGGQYNITPATGLMLSVGNRNVANSTRDQLSILLGVNYDLSKRTTLYARYLNLTNKGNASVSATGLTVTPNSGDDLSSVAFGITHRF